MLFNSINFIVLFFPVVLLVSYFLLKKNWPIKFLHYWLTIASLFFYAYWNPYYLFLICPSIFFNYLFGLLLKKRKSSVFLAVFVAFNIILLGYFKYSSFVVSWFAIQLDFKYPELPLAISFFTFQQISFLVDTYRTDTYEKSLLRYSLFVSFFPQLIAGPIVRHSQIKDQLKCVTLNQENIITGFSIFILGLAKKIIIADRLAGFSTHYFTGTIHYDILSAWTAALCFAFEIYFDFSGYSDMAIGLARIFGLRFPDNFKSPYKSTSIIQFWRSWHITLSLFLRDYLYIPLGGNRKGEFRKYINLFITMVLGGLWHGASWTFVIWGIIHGIFLIINHLWLHLKTRFHILLPTRILFLLSWILTFTCVVGAFVVFKSNNLGIALKVWAGMLGVNGGIALQVPPSQKESLSFLHWFGIKLITDIPVTIETYSVYPLLAFCLFIMWLPNSIQLCQNSPRKSLNIFFLGFISAICLALLNEDSPFIYFVF